MLRIQNLRNMGSGLVFATFKPHIVATCLGKTLSSKRAVYVPIDGTITKLRREIFHSLITLTDSLSQIVLFKLSRRNSPSYAPAPVTDATST